MSPGLSGIGGNSTPITVYPTSVTSNSDANLEIVTDENNTAPSGISQLSDEEVIQLVEYASGVANNSVYADDIQYFPIQIGNSAVEEEESDEVRILSNNSASIISSDEEAVSDVISIPLNQIGNNSSNISGFRIRITVKGKDDEVNSSNEAQGAQQNSGVEDTAGNINADNTTQGLSNEEIKKHKQTEIDFLNTYKNKLIKGLSLNGGNRMSPEVLSALADCVVNYLKDNNVSPGNMDSFANDYFANYLKQKGISYSNQDLDDAKTVMQGLSSAGNGRDGVNESLSLEDLTEMAADYFEQLDKERNDEQNYLDSKKDIISHGLEMLGGDKMKKSDLDMLINFLSAYLKDDTITNSNIDSVVNKFNDYQRNVVGSVPSSEDLQNVKTVLTNLYDCANSRSNLYQQFSMEDYVSVVNEHEAYMENTYNTNHEFLSRSRNFVNQQVKNEQNVEGDSEKGVVLNGLTDFIIDNLFANGRTITEADIPNIINNEFKAYLKDNYIPNVASKYMNNTFLAETTRNFDSKFGAAELKYAEDTLKRFVQQYSQNDSNGASCSYDDITKGIQNRFQAHFNLQQNIDVMNNALLKIENASTDYRLDGRLINGTTRGIMKYLADGNTLKKDDVSSFVNNYLNDYFKSQNFNFYGQEQLDKIQQLVQHFLLYYDNHDDASGDFVNKNSDYKNELSAVDLFRTIQTGRMKDISKGRFGNAQR